MKWFGLKSSKPKHGQRVLVWDSYYSQAQILCWNDRYNLWDDESGDDLYSKQLGRFHYWTNIPEFSISELEVKTTAINN